MPNWNELLDNIRRSGSAYDTVRRECLSTLYAKTGRNVIIYYSGWLQSPDGRGSFAINDHDKVGFMSACSGLDKSKGLDLLLHTPGGDLAATESIVDYLRNTFSDIRAVIPQLAMSGGTMIACSAKSILMGKQSSLGPIDPQMGNIPAHGVIEEFKQAHAEIKRDPTKAAVWQPIIAKYAPTFVGECQKAIKWSEKIVRDWLATGMFDSDPDAATKITNILTELGDHSLTLSHSRHLSAQTCQDMGLVVEMLEDDDDLQDAVLSVHHACVHTLSATPAVKIIENHHGTAFINTVTSVAMQ